MQNSDNWKAKYKEKGWDPERYGKKAPKYVGRLTNVEGEEDSTTDQVPSSPIFSQRCVPVKSSVLVIVPSCNLTLSLCSLMT